MSSRRIMILGVAVLLGLGAMLLTMRYVSGVEDQAASETELVRAVVAGAPIPRNTRGADAAALMRVEEIPANGVPVDAISDPAEVSANLSLLDIQPDTVIGSSMFAPDSVANQSSSQRVPKGYVAVSIQTDLASGVAGLISPGDRVDLFIGPEAATTQNDGALPDPGQDGGGSESAEADAEFANRLRGRMLFRHVEVFAVDRNLAPLPGQVTAPDGETPAQATAGGGLLTLIAPPEAAGVITAAAKQLTISVALVNPEDTPRPVSVWPPLDPGELLLPGEDDRIVTPEGLAPEGALPEADEIPAEADPAAGEAPSEGE